MIGDYKIHHVGIVTDSIDATKSFYEEIGFKASNTIMDPIQKVNICLLTKIDECCIELVEPANEVSSVNKLIKKVGVSPYHICYEVENVDKEFDMLTEQENFIPLFRPVEAVAMNNRLVCYLYRKDVGYIELINK